LIDTVAEAPASDQCARIILEI